MHQCSCRQAVAIAAQGQNVSTRALCSPAEDERATLERLLEELGTENAVWDGGIESTGEWIKQVKVRLAEIETFLKAVE